MRFFVSSTSTNSSSRSINQPATTTRAATRESIDALTGVRILAALWVLISHMDKELFTLFPASKVLQPFLGSGFLGVDLFFILSGFIISYNYAPRFDGSFGSSTSNSLSLNRVDQRADWWRMYVRFLWLRIARLYPVHLLTLFAVLGMYLASQVMHVKLNMDDGYGAFDFVRNLFLVHAWFSYDFNWNGPSWSISAEWFAYLMFPVFAVLTARVKNNWQVLTTLAVLVTLPLLNSLGENNPLLNVLHLLRITTEFVAGCLLYRLYVRGAGSSLPWPILTPLAGILVIVVAAVLEPLGTTLFWVSPLLALFVYGVSQQRGAFTMALAGPRMVFWGQVSYSVYMTHSIVRTVLRKFLQYQHFADSSILIRLGILGVYGLCFAGAAVLTYLYVEEPARHWLRKRMPA
jgi:peptidoglycan/LPS O-acetylase OafA/YrhL